MLDLRNRLDRSEKLLVLGVVILLLGACLVEFYIQESLVAYALAGVVGFMLVLYIYDRRRMPEEMHDRLKNESKQLESLASLHVALIDDSPPLPDTRGWAASPDLLKLTAELIHEEQPSLIVEAGSGVSTVVYGRILKGKSGKVCSLEHELTYHEKSSRLIETHGLTETCRVHHTPLVSHMINEEDWMWYDLDDVHLDRPIDLLFIDGPPERIQTLSRYPAVPLLFEHLSEEAVIVLDDGGREEEEEIVRKWTQEYPSLEAEYKSLEKGAFVIRRGSESR
jgi:predicted O-methyltransferase YrrM